MTSGNRNPTSGRRLIDAAGLPEHEAWRLLAAVTQQSPGTVRAGVELSPNQEARFKHMVRRRLSGEPLQYLEGSVPFGPIEVTVDRRVLIPRPETEYLYSLAAEAASSPGLIVDLCTGSGALALALKHRFPDALVIGTDVAAEALELAALNGVRNGLEVEWRQGDLFSALPDGLRRRVDLLVSNPPYVAAAEWDRLPVDVRHEPYGALVAGPEGTEIVEQIIDQVGGWLAPVGQAWIEVGDRQAELLARRHVVEVVPDQYGLPRFLLTRARPAGQTSDRRPAAQP
jgi:release factor glutamine methyltransferase